MFFIFHLSLSKFVGIKHILIAFFLSISAIFCNSQSVTISPMLGDFYRPSQPWPLCLSLPSDFLHSNQELVVNINSQTILLYGTYCSTTQIWIYPCIQSPTVSVSILQNKKQILARNFHLQPLLHTDWLVGYYGYHTTMPWIQNQPQVITGAGQRKIILLPLQIWPDTWQGWQGLTCLILKNTIATEYQEHNLSQFLIMGGWVLLAGKDVSGIMATLYEPKDTALQIHPMGSGLLAWESQATSDSIFDIPIAEIMEQFSRSTPPFSKFQPPNSVWNKIPVAPNHPGKTVVWICLIHCILTMMILGLKRRWTAIYTKLVSTTIQNNRHIKIPISLFVSLLTTLLVGGILFYLLFTFSGQQSKTLEILQIPIHVNQTANHFATAFVYQQIHTIVKNEMDVTFNHWPSQLPDLINTTTSFIITPQYCSLQVSSLSLPIHSITLWQTKYPKNLIDGIELTDIEDQMILVNRTPWVIQDVWYVQQSRAYFLGDIPIGRRITIHKPLPAISSAQNTLPKLVPPLVKTGADTTNSEQPPLNHLSPYTPITPIPASHVKAPSFIKQEWSGLLHLHHSTYLVGYVHSSTTTSASLLIIYAPLNYE